MSDTEDGEEEEIFDVENWGAIIQSARPSKASPRQWSHREQAHHVLFSSFKKQNKKGKKMKTYLFDIDHNMFFLTNQQVVYPPMYGTHHLLPLALFFYCFQSTDSKASYAVE